MSSAANLMPIHSSVRRQKKRDQIESGSRFTKSRARTTVQPRSLHEQVALLLKKPAVFLYDFTTWGLALTAHPVTFEHENIIGTR